MGNIKTNNKKKYDREYYLDNKEKIDAYQKKWREENKEHIQQYLEDKSEHIRATQKEYRKNNKEHLKLLWDEWYQKNPQRSPRRRFTDAIKKARKRNIEWYLTFDEYKKVIKLPCYYCDNKLGEPVKRSVGLDRLDSDKGYKIDNIVSCCYICNCIKNIFLTPEETRAAVEAIIIYRSLNKLSEPIILEESPIISPNKEQIIQFRKRYKEGKRSIKKRKIAWLLTFDEYVSVAYLPCYYCNNKLWSVSKSTAGLDRINSDIGYQKDNIVSCCYTCNCVKGNFLTIEETLIAVKVILDLRFSCKS